MYVLKNLMQIGWYNHYSHTCNEIGPKEIGRGKQIKSKSSLALSLQLYIDPNLLSCAKTKV